MQRFLYFTFVRFSNAFLRKQDTKKGQEQEKPYSNDKEKLGAGYRHRIHDGESSRIGAGEQAAAV